MNQWYSGSTPRTRGDDDRRDPQRGPALGAVLGQNINNGAISNFTLDELPEGRQEHVFVNAPAGLLYPGDAGFPPGNTGLNKQWLNFSPRVGVAWDVSGDGRTAVRSSYGISYDFPTAQYLQHRGRRRRPFGNRVAVTGNVPFDDPYRDCLGGNTLRFRLAAPDTPFPGSARIGAIDPNINSPRVQSWNVTVERQIGAAWQVSASYLGSYTDRLWGRIAINPGVTSGSARARSAACRSRSARRRAIWTRRRALSLENPADAGSTRRSCQYDGRRHAELSRPEAVVPAPRRSGVSLSAQLHAVALRRPTRTSSGGFTQFTTATRTRATRAYDPATAPTNRRQIANVTVGAQTPHSPTRRCGGRVGLARVGHRQRAFGQLAQR